MPPEPRGRGRHRGRDPFRDTVTPPFAPFGHGGPGGPFGRLGFGFGRGPKARRGDVRAAALLLLAEDPRNGYQLMQEIENRTRGMWRPSPGSMYPVLQQLEDEGLVRPEGPEGRRVYQLTDAGRDHVKEHASELGAPWDAVNCAVGDDVADFHTLLMQTMIAARQLAHVASTRQLEEAEKVLTETRRRLYRILAEEEVEG
jgi:DNA-binding PadR family transcriptional regulator